MTGFKALGFKNYRVFAKETLLKLAPVSILTGPNSSGKSSVIKAAKLLKQNITKESYSGLPVSLEFIPDEFGHYLGEFSRIVSRNSKDDNISFILPINLETLGNDFYCAVDYGPTIEGNSIGKIALKSVTIFKDINSQKTQLARIIGSFGDFYEMEINPSLFKDCLVNVCLPLLKTPEELNDSMAVLIHRSKRERLPGFELLSYIIDNLEFFNNAEPILPFYKVLTESREVEFIEPENEQSLNLKAIFEKAISYFKEAIQNYSKKNKISVDDAIIEYFKKQEEILFDYLANEMLRFPIDFSLDYKHLGWWNGILIDDNIDNDIKTSNEFKNSLFSNFGPLSALMWMYQYSENKHGKPEPPDNTKLFYHYIQYIIVQSMEQCRNDLSQINFFDSNRIEQVLFYHNSNAGNAYRLINDYFNNQKSSGSADLNLLSTKLRSLGIAEECSIKPLDFGIYSVQLLKGNNWVPIAELGYGISKLFFLLLAINTYDTLFIEEPESNLHPDLQAKLADILIEAINSKKQIIIETHSEYLIRKLQYLVATSKIDKDKIIINYFNPPQLRKKEGLLREIRIKRDGSLDREFGKGFYDEASSIIKDLFNLTYYN